MTQLAFNATEWRSAEWAREKGLYADVFENTVAMDEAIISLARQLAKSNPEAMRLMKSAFWQDAAHWDKLLDERAAMSGKLVLSDFTKKAIEKFKSKS